MHTQIKQKQCDNKAQWCENEDSEREIREMEKWELQTPKAHYTLLAFNHLGPDSLKNLQRALDSDVHKQYVFLQEFFRNMAPDTWQSSWVWGSIFQTGVPVSLGSSADPTSSGFSSHTDTGWLFHFSELEKEYGMLPFPISTNQSISHTSHSSEYTLRNTV